MCVGVCVVMCGEVKTTSNSTWCRGVRLLPRQNTSVSASTSTSAAMTLLSPASASTTQLILQVTRHYSTQFMSPTIYDFFASFFFAIVLGFNDVEPAVYYFITFCGDTLLVTNVATLKRNILQLYVWL